MSEKELKKNGYKEFPPSSGTSPYCNRLFQKRFRNEKGSTKYFINFNEYVDFTGHYQYEVELNFQKENYNMNITLFGIKNITIKEIEKEVYDIWYGLDCKYYDNEEVQID